MADLSNYMGQQIPRFKGVASQPKQPSILPQFGGSPVAGTNNTIFKTPQGTMAPPLPQNMLPPSIPQYWSQPKLYPYGVQMGRVDPAMSPQMGRVDPIPSPPMSGPSPLPYVPMSGPSPVPAYLRRAQTPQGMGVNRTRNGFLNQLMRQRLMQMFRNRGIRR